LPAAEPELRGTPADLRQHLEGLPRSVFITGESTVEVQADRATVNLSVVTENKLLGEALKKNEQLRRDLTRALIEQGVPPDRIKSSRFSSTPEYGKWVSSERPKSYRVENEVKVTVESEAHFQAVAALVDQWPEIRYESIQPEHTEKDAQKLKALAQAVEDALRKKAAYERLLQVTLKPKGIEEPVESGDILASVARQLPFRAKSASPMPSFSGYDVGVVGSSFGGLIYKSIVRIEFAVAGR
jgi:uncharacterized protein